MAKRTPKVGFSEKHYVMHRGVCGNCAYWWRVGGSGYTCDLEEAMLVEREEAERICRDRPTEDFPVPQTAAVAASRRHVDINVLWLAGYGRPK